MKKIAKKLLRVGFILCFLCGTLSGRSLAAQDCQKIRPPDAAKYMNPYQLMTADKIIPVDVCTEWQVICERDQAPIFPGERSPDLTSQPIQTAKYFEVFTVLQRKGTYLQVQSKTRPIMGWMDMRHLILTLKAIKDPDTQVHQKLFLKVKQPRFKITAEEGTNVLRFRNGPGVGREKDAPLAEAEAERYDFLIEKEDLPQVGSLFYFVYGVYFESFQLTSASLATLKVARLPDAVSQALEPLQDQEPAGKIEFLKMLEKQIGQDQLVKYKHLILNAADQSREVYQDTVNFKDAAYFLVGNIASASITNDIENAANPRILGWIPKEAAVLWDTRQALTKWPDRQNCLPGACEAHKFSKRPRLNEYFSLDAEKKAAFLEEHSTEVVPDLGDGPPQSGQQLRDIVVHARTALQEQYPILSAEIGYVGSSNDSASAKQRRLEDFLAQMHRGEKTLELLFLVDARPGSGASLQAVGNVIQRLYQQPDSTLTIISHAALYRDANAGIRKYEEWWNLDANQIRQCFFQTPAATVSPSNSPVLFEAITRAVDSWRKRFTDPFSTKVLLIIGTEGNENPSAPGSSDIPSVIETFQKNGVLPLVLHVQHVPPTRTESVFTDQLNQIGRSIYNDPTFHFMKGVVQTDFEKNLARTVGRVTENITQLIQEMPAIRVGTQSFCNSICNRAYEACSDVLSGCNAACENEMGNVMQYLQEYPPCVGRTETTDMGLTLAYINTLQRNNPELWEYLKTRPEAAFDEGFVAVRKMPCFQLTDTALQTLRDKDIPEAVLTSLTPLKNLRCLSQKEFWEEVAKRVDEIAAQKHQESILNAARQKPEEPAQITRPVLLLQDTEIDVIKKKINFLITACRTYHVETEKTAAQAQQMAAILGELSQTESQTVSTETQNIWSDVLKGLINQGGTIVTQERWDAWILELEKADRFIVDLLTTRSRDPKIEKRRQERLYTDIQAGEYFWVYPEEIFPPFPQEMVP